MALINVRRVVIEEVNRASNNVLPDGKRFTIDCNDNVDFTPIYVNGQEKIYSNGNQIIEYNYKSPIIYGYDFTMQFTDFTMELFSFFSSGKYAGTPTEATAYGLLLGGMKTTHSIEENKHSNLFRSVLYVTRYAGAEIEGYYRIGCDVCHADYVPLNFNGTDFTDLQVTVHARDDYKAGRTNIKIEPVANLGS